MLLQKDYDIKTVSLRFNKVDKIYMYKSINQELKEGNFNDPAAQA